MINIDKSKRTILNPEYDRRNRVDDYKKYPFVGRITGIGSGTGFVVGRDYIVTNKHVANNSKKQKLAIPVRSGLLKQEILTRSILLEGFISRI